MKIPEPFIPFIEKILSSKWNNEEIKVYLWFYLLANANIREIPTNEKDISKIYQKLGMTLETFLRSLRKLNIVPSEWGKGISLPVSVPDSPAINSARVHAIVKYWIEKTGILLTISEKVTLAELCETYPELHAKDEPEILNHIDNFAIYQEAFSKATILDRNEAYLFRNSFRSFVANFMKFGPTFSTILTEHKARFETYKNKPIVYGFSSDPIEDRRLAQEEELQNICLSLLLEQTYDKPILFPVNMDFYTKKLKKIDKKKEKTK